MVCIVHVGILYEIPIMRLKYRNRGLNFLAASRKQALGKDSVLDITLFLCVG